MRIGLDPLRHLVAPTWRTPGWTALSVTLVATVWAGFFALLSVSRMQAGGAHAEDLGFTDQVVWNFLRGQWFRMSIYDGAFWNTELNVLHLARPDSLLAFHVEPLLLAFVPLYALGAGPAALLIVQALAVASGALLAYRLGRARIGSSIAAVAVAVAYLVSPLGYSAVLADMHTVTLAIPLILLMVERLLVARAPWQAAVSALLASFAREDVGLVVALLGLALAVENRQGRAGLGLAAIGLAWTAIALSIVRVYSGGDLTFSVRYGEALSAGVPSLLAALTRTPVMASLITLVLTGGWLVPLGPLAFVAALPTLALNAASSSPWMMTGKAHYAALLLPIVCLCTVAGLARLRTRPRALRVASGALIGLAVLGAVRDPGAVLAALPTLPSMTHMRTATAIADRLPGDASVSASSSLVPLLTHRPRVYVFPAVNGADHVLLDLRSGPAPTSAGDVFLRTRALLQQGGWQVDAATDGVLLLSRNDAAGPTDVSDLSATLRHPTDPDIGARTPAIATYLDGRVALLRASLLPSADASLDVDGPRGVLHTVWRATAPIAAGTRLSVDVTLRDQSRLHIWDSADLWWNAPDTWPQGEDEAVVVDIPDIPSSAFRSWSPIFSSPE